MSTNNDTSLGAITTYKDITITYSDGSKLTLSRTDAFSDHDIVKLLTPYSYGYEEYVRHIARWRGVHKFVSALALVARLSKRDMSKSANLIKKYRYDTLVRKASNDVIESLMHPCGTVTNTYCTAVCVPCGSAIASVARMHMNGGAYYISAKRNGVSTKYYRINAIEQAIYAVRRDNKKINRRLGSEIICPSDVKVRTYTVTDSTAI